MMKMGIAMIRRTVILLASVMSRLSSIGPTWRDGFERAPESPFSLFLRREHPYAHGPVPAGRLLQMKTKVRAPPTAPPTAVRWRTAEHPRFPRFALKRECLNGAERLRAAREKDDPFY